MKTSPAFQFYPNDFLMDENVAAMSLAERGLYITLLCYCWREGSIPNPDLDAVALPAHNGGNAAPHSGGNARDRLARILGISEAEFATIWQGCKSCFRPSEDGFRLVNPRLEAERQAQSDFRKQQALRAEARWNKASMPAHKSGNATASKRHRSGKGAAIPKDRNAPQSSILYRIELLRNSFGECAELVRSLLDLRRLENKTGRVAEPVLLGLVDALKAKRDEIADDRAFRAGLEAAVAASAPNVNYVAKAARSALQRPPTGARPLQPRPAAAMSEPGQAMAERMAAAGITE